MSPRSSVAVGAAAAAAFAALAVLVAAGSLTGVDQWAIDQAMPGGVGSGRAPTLARAVVPLLGARWGSGVSVAANVVTLPAQALIGSALVAAGCLLLARRRRRRDAAVWAVLWVAANAIEVLCKGVLTRPALHRGSLHVAAFDSSFPSGHALRTVLVAALAATVRPSLRLPLGAWAVTSVVLLELSGAHVPTDLASGVLLALVALAVRKAWLPSRPSSSCSSSSCCGAAPAAPSPPSRACRPSARAR